MSCINGFSLKLLAFCFLGIATHKTLGQSSENNPSIYVWFDNIVGIESSDIHYGQAYSEKHRMKNVKTKFFMDPNFRSGVVYFNKQAYFNLNLKYDVSSDNLILQVKNRFGGTPLLIPKENIDSFHIENHRFKKVGHLKSKAENLQGFYEIYHSSQFFKVLKKHRKRLDYNLGLTRIYHEFEDLEPIFLVEHKKEFFILGKIKDLVPVFPEYDKELERIQSQLGRSAKPIDHSSIDVLIDFLEEKLSGIDRNG